jgi:hypothetical protein
MDEIIKLKTLIEKGINVSENYDKLEELFMQEETKIKNLKRIISTEIHANLVCKPDEIDNLVNNFLNVSSLNNNIQTDYMNIVKRINYLIDKNDKSIIKMKKINYTGNKVKLENIP